MQPLILHGQRVTLRSLTEADLPCALEILLQPGVAEWWSGYDIARLGEEALGDPTVTTLAVEFEDEMIGIVMFTEVADPYYRSAGIDIALAAPRTGLGLGSDTLRTLARYLFEVRGHHRLTIDPAVDNLRAIAAYRKVGFKPVGVMRAHEKGPDGTFHDNLAMDMLAEDLR